MLIQLDLSSGVKKAHYDYFISRKNIFDILSFFVERSMDNILRKICSTELFDTSTAIPFKSTPIRALFRNSKK